MKKAQISTFIIIGMIILIAFSFLFYIVYKVNIYSKNIDDFNNIKNFLDSCISDNIEQEIRLLALQGCDLHQNNIGNIKGSNITLLKKGDSNLMQSIETIEKQLENSLGRRYEECISNSYNIFTGIKIENKGQVFDISIKDIQVLAEAKLSTKISKGGSSTKYKRFIYQRNISLGYIISLIDASIDQMIEKGYDIEKLELIRNDLEVNITQYKYGNIFSVVDPDSNVGGQPLQIIYAAE